MWAFRAICEGINRAFTAKAIFPLARAKPGANRAPHPGPGRDANRAVKRSSGRSSGVEHNLAKVGVEGSNPFARSSFSCKINDMSGRFGFGALACPLLATTELPRTLFQSILPQQSGCVSGCLLKPDSDFEERSPILPTQDHRGSQGLTDPGSYQLPHQSRAMGQGTTPAA